LDYDAPHRKQSARRFFLLEISASGVAWREVAWRAARLRFGRCDERREFERRIPALAGRCVSLGKRRGAARRPQLADASVG